MSIFDEGTGSISLGGTSEPGGFAQKIALDIVEKLIARRWPKDLAVKLIAEALDTAYSDGFADAITDEEDESGSITD